MSSNTALLLIDLQVGPFRREMYDGKKLFRGEQLLRNFGFLIRKARALAVPIIYLRHTGSENTFMGKGKPAWELHPQIKPAEDDLVILKYHIDPFLNTILNQELKSLNVKKLIITGVQTEFCIDTACRSAFGLGYENILVSDGHSTFDSDLLSAAQIIKHHQEIIGGRAPFTELRFAELKKTIEVEF